MKSIKRFREENGLERVVEFKKFESDNGFEGSIRPKGLNEYIGQEKIKKNLKVFIQASLKREEALDHILFSGPPGLGKTTLSNIIAYEMGRDIKTTSAPMIEKSGDLAALLTNLEEGDILFIDEIHRLSPAIEEILYPAMEDYRLDIIIGSGPAVQTIRVDLPRFTLIGATTRSGMLSNPLRDRFGMHFRLEFYSDRELSKIVTQASKKLSSKIEDDASFEIARRSRGTPRVALRLLRRVRDYSQVAEERIISLKTAKYALKELGVDRYGFDEQDIKLLELLISNRGKPIGLSTMAAVLSEDEGTIEEVIEPFLIANGFIERTPRGRVATNRCYEIFRLSSSKLGGLFG
jgi:Holliday junction DNA helicase RuvB